MATNILSLGFFSRVLHWLSLVFSTHSARSLRIKGLEPQWTYPWRITLSLAGATPFPKYLQWLHFHTRISRCCDSRSSWVQVKPSQCLCSVCCYCADYSTATTRLQLFYQSQACASMSSCLSIETQQQEISLSAQQSDGKVRSSRSLVESSVCLEQSTARNPSWMLHIISKQESNTRMIFLEHFCILKNNEYQERVEKERE